jgi:hypothetical protein
MIRETRIFSHLVLLSSCVPCANPLQLSRKTSCAFPFCYRLSVGISEHRGPGGEWR